MKTKQLFKVMKVSGFDYQTGRKQLLCKNLTEEQAQIMVKSFPGSDRSMVVYYRQ